MPLVTLDTANITAEDIDKLESALTVALGDSEAKDFIVSALKQGKTLMASDVYLSSSEAAKILGISRPFACHLMDTGAIAFTWNGKKRQTTLAAVRDYMHRSEQASAAYVAAIANREDRIYQASLRRAKTSEAELLALEEEALSEE